MDDDRTAPSTSSSHDIVITGALDWGWFRPFDSEGNVVTGEANVDAYDGLHSLYPTDTHTMDLVESYSEDVGWL